MPPKDFEDHAKDAFDRIKNSVGTKLNEITYQHKSGGTANIKGIFDDRAQDVDPDTEQPVSSNVYTLGIKLDDLLKAPVKGDKITIKKKLYRVVDALEDGIPGVSTVLVLHRADS